MLKILSSGRSLHRLVLVGGALAATTLLASCGGGGSDNGMMSSAPAADTLAAAQASPNGFIAFLKILVPMQPDNTQPLDLTGFVAPTSDNTPPDPSI